jgi:hypothetical protein
MVDPTADGTEDDPARLAIVLARILPLEPSRIIEHVDKKRELPLCNPQAA